MGKPKPQESTRMPAGDAAPVRRWAPGRLEPAVEQAIARLARADDVQRIAIMPDVHLARGVCVGTAFATTRLVYPEAVGGDIGCGMATLALRAGAGDLARADTLTALHTKLNEHIPVIRHPAGRGRASAPDLRESDLSDPALAKLAARDGLVQFATLGRGNHFLEFQADEDGGLWIMVHSGSRAVGQAILSHHLQRAESRSAGLAALDTGADAGHAYMNDLAWARA